MNIVFITDIFNHHQADLAKGFEKFSQGNFIYITTKEISQERKNLGWGNEFIPTYVVDYWNNLEMCQKLIFESEIVIFGSVPYKIVRNRINSNKLTFCYSERPFKNIRCWMQYPLRMFKYLIEGGTKHNLFLLASSAYATADYNKCFCFKNRSYKWGYFPTLRHYQNVDELISKKDRNSIIWVGRMIKWKHPEYAIFVANYLKNKGVTFSIKMIGVGPEIENIKGLIKKYKLNGFVNLLGALKPNEVRNEMEKSQFLLFTSDYNEGWGAVVNEGMNSCCAIIASNAGGSVPYLIKNNKNGVMFSRYRIKESGSEIEKLINDYDKLKFLMKNAYKTIIDEWNGEIASARLVKLAKYIFEGEKGYKVFKTGPCSKA